MIQSLLDALGCLADDTRLRLLRLLESQELGVGELSQVVQLPQPTVSRHLKTLSDANFVSSRREGTSNLYRMRLTELPEAARELWLVARDQAKRWPELEQDARRLAELMKEKQSASKAFFAGAAAEWDRLRTDLYGEGFTTSALLSLLPPAAVIADLACGTGATSAMVAPFVGKVYAVDNSPEMLTAARTRNAEAGNVEVIEGDLTALPLGSGTCDGALLLVALTYVSDPLPAITEAARVLKSGGMLVIVDLLPHAREDFRRKLNQLHAGFEPGVLGEMLASAHLSVVRNGVALASPPEAKGPTLFLTVARKG